MPARPTGLDGPPSAVIYDMDGIIFDTEPIWLEAETIVFARRGLDFPPELARRIMGVPGPKAMAIVLEHFKLDEDPEIITIELNALFHELLETRLVLMPGFLDRLAWLESAGVPRSVATSTERTLAHSMLGRFGLLERFAFILTRNDVRAGKPDPEIYQTSCDRLGVEPGRAVVFEDSVAGTQSARRAGCYVVALRHPLTMGLEFEHAHLVVDSHADELVGRTLGIA